MKKCQWKSNLRVHFNNISKCIFLNENDRIPIQISLKFVPDSSTDINLAVV